MRNKAKRGSPEAVAAPVSRVEDRLRTFLFALAAAMCLGTIVELALANHTKQVIQWLPFGLAY